MNTESQDATQSSANAEGKVGVEQAEKNGATQKTAKRKKPKTEAERKAEKKEAAERARKEKSKGRKEAICAYFAKLKQTKYWLSLLLILAMVFLGIGYFTYQEKEYLKSTDFIEDTLSTAFQKKDVATLLKVLNISVTQDRLRKSIQHSFEENPDFARYIGVLAEADVFQDAFEIILMDIVQERDRNPEFNKELHLLPENLASQIRTTPFVFNEKASNPAQGTYIFETSLETIRFGKYPLQIKARYLNDMWHIVEIANIDSLIKHFNAVIKKTYMREEAYKAQEQKNTNERIQSYLPNLRCTANITQLSGQDVLIIHVMTDQNNAPTPLISWAVDTHIYLPDNSKVHEEYIKANGLFKAQSAFSYTKNIVLQENLKNLSGHNLRCEAFPVMVNLPDGSFFEYSE